MSKTPWYHDGLRFQCTGCGECCIGAPGYVWVNKEEIAAIAGRLGMDVEAFEDLYVRRIGIRRSLREFPNGDCVFFDTETRRCQIYDIRPRQCGTWPFWKSNLKSPEAWEQTAEFCPGCGRGRRVSQEKIDEQAGVMQV